MSDQPVTRSELRDTVRELNIRRILLFAVIILTIMFIGWDTEYGSCERFKKASEIQNMNVSVAEQKLHIKYTRYPVPVCFKLFPDRP